MQDVFCASQEATSKQGCSFENEEIKANPTFQLRSSRIDQVRMIKIEDKNTKVLYRL